MTSLRLPSQDRTLDQRVQPRHHPRARADDRETTPELLVHLAERLVEEVGVLQRPKPIALVSRRF